MEVSQAESAGSSHHLNKKPLPLFDEFPYRFIDAKNMIYIINTHPNANCKQLFGGKPEEFVPVITFGFGLYEIPGDFWGEFPAIGITNFVTDGSTQRIIQNLLNRIDPKIFIEYLPYTFRDAYLAKT